MVVGVGFGGGLLLHYQYKSITSFSEIVCTESQRACRDNSGCYSTYQICNGFRDCLDGSDETNCGKY